MKGPFLQLKASRPSREDTLNALIRQISSNHTVTEAPVFKQIRDFFFQLPPIEFEKYANATTGPLVATLCHYGTRANNQPVTPELQKFKTDILSLLCFLGYRVNDSTTPEYLQYFANQIIEGSVEDLSFYIRIIKNSFETPENDFEKKYKTAAQTIFHACSTRLGQLLGNIENLKDNEIVPVISLMTILLTCVKHIEVMRNVFQTLRPHFENIINMEVPESYSFVHKTTIMLIKIKAGILIGNSSLNTSVAFPSTINLIVNSYMSILRKAPHVVSTIVDEAITSFIYFLKQDNEKSSPRNEEVSKYLNEILDYNHFSNENFTGFKTIILFIIENLQKMDKLTKSNLIAFCKFEAGVLHFSDLTYSICYSRFNEILQLIKLPTDDPKLRSSILTLFFNSIDAGFVEMDINLENTKPNIGDQTLLTQVLPKLSMLTECFYKLLKYFNFFLTKLSPNDLTRTKQLMRSLSYPMRLIDMEIILSCFRHALLFIMKFRNMLQRGGDLIKDLSPVGKLEKNLKLCAQNIRNLKSYDRIRHYHLGSTTEMVKCLVNVPTAMVSNIWDLFLEDFFNLPEPLYFDSCCFRSVLIELNVMGPFIHSLVQYTIKQFRNGYSITHLIRSIMHLLEKLILKPINATRTPEFCQDIQKDGLSLCAACIELVHSPVYCNDIILAVKVFCQFFDFVIGSKPFPFILKVLTEKNVTEICNAAAANNAPAKTVCTFLNYCFENNQDLIKLKAAISLLIKCLPSEFEEILVILKKAKKKDKVHFFMHPSMPLFYARLIEKMNTQNETLKKEICKFLHHIPKNILENIPFLSSPVSKSKTLILQQGEEIVRVDSESFLHAVNSAMNSFPQTEAIWDVWYQTISAAFMVENWTPDYRRYLQSLLAFTLPIRAKNTSAADHFIAHLLNEFGNNISVISHIFCSICSYYQTPPDSLVNPIFNIANTKEKMSEFITEVSFIADLQIFSTYAVGEHICRLIISRVDSDLLDPVVLALFIHRTIMNAYEPTWKDYQRSDSLLHMMELDFVPRPLQKLILFARNKLEKEDCNVQPILEVMRTSNAFFSLIVLSELLCKVKYNDNIKKFIGEVITDKQLANELSLYRFLGPIFRAFPEAIDHYKTEIDELVNEYLSTIGNLSPKQQGTFLVLLVPVLERAEDLTPYNEIISHVLHFFDHPNSFLKCQAQMAVKLFIDKGNNDIRVQITNFVATKLRDAKLTDFDKSPNKLTLIQWRNLYSSMFSCYMIDIKTFEETIRKQLEVLKDQINDPHVQQSCFGRDVISNLKELVGFVATGSYVNYLVSNGLFQTYAKLFTGMLLTISLFPRLWFSSTMAEFFSFAPQEFNTFLKNGIDNPVFLQFIVIISASSKFDDLLHGAEEELVSVVKEKLTFEDKLTNTHCFLACIATKFSSAKTDEELTDKLYKIMHGQLNAFVDDITLFSPFILSQIMAFFRSNHPSKYLQTAFHIFEIRNPLLLTEYAQEYSKMLTSPELTKEIFFNLEFSDNTKLNSLFFNILLPSYLAKNNSDTMDVLKFVKEKFNLFVFISFCNHLADKKIEIDRSKINFIEIYNASEDDDTRLQTLLFWGRGEQTDCGVFVEMFEHFTSFFHMNIPVEIRQVSMILKMPKDLTAEQEKHILMKLGDLQRQYIKSPHVINCIFKLLNNGAGSLKRHPIIAYYYLIQEHIIGIETANKRTAAHVSAPLFNEFVHLINGDFQEKEIPLANHLAAFVQKTLRTARESLEFFTKVRAEFYKSILRLLPHVSPIIPLGMDIINFFIEVEKKTQYQTNSTQPILEDQIFNIFIQFIPDVVEILCKSPQFQCSDALIDIFVHIAKSNNSLFWPYASLCIYHLLTAPYIYPRVAEKLQVEKLESDIVTRMFQILWRYPPTPSYRNEVLLSHAIKYTQSITAENPISPFLSESMLIFMLENPTETSTPLLVYTAIKSAANIENEENRNFVVRLIGQVLSMEPADTILEKTVLKLIKIPAVAAVFFRHSSIAMRNKVEPKLPLSAKVISAFRLYPKLEDDITKAILDEGMPKVLQLCKNTGQPHIPFASFMAPFFGKIDIPDMLKIIQYIPSEKIAGILPSIKEAEGDRSLRFVLGRGQINQDFALGTWPQRPDNDIEFAKEELCARPKLRYRMGYIVDPVEMSGYIPRVDYEMTKQILKLPEYISSEVLELLNNEFDVNALTNIINSACSVASQASLTDFLVTYETKRLLVCITKGDKPNKSLNQLFSFNLLPTDTPQLHEIYQRIRQKSVELLDNVNDIRGRADENLHIEAMKRSAELYSHVLPSYRTSDFIVCYKNDVAKLICRLYSVAVNIDEAVLDKLADAVKSDPSSDEVLAVIYANLHRIGGRAKTIADNIGKIPFRWAHLFAKKVAKNSELSPFIPHIGNQFKIILAKSDSIIPVDTARDISSITVPLKNITKTATAKRIKEAISTQTPILDEEKSFALSLGAVFLAPVVAPLYEEETGSATSMLAYTRNSHAHSISIQIQTSSGIKASYELTYGNPMKAKFAMLSSALTRLLMLSPASRIRQIRLPSILSVGIADGFYLSRTSATPLVDAIAPGEDNVVREVNPNPHSFGTREFFEWYGRVGSRYGALSGIQVFLNASTPQPFQMMVDSSLPAITVPTLVRTDEERPLLRLFGSVRQILDDCIIGGRMRTGFIAAADAFCLQRPSVVLLLRALHKMSLDEASTSVDRSQAYSTFAPDTDEAQERLNKLIEASSNPPAAALVPSAQWL